MKNTTAVGLRAEQLASEYLTKKGYTIVGRNFRNRYCEIDILATKKAINEFVSLLKKLI